MLFFLSIATPLSAATYLRFSTLPIEDIQRRLYLDSERFVFAMFESMVPHNIVKLIMFVMEVYEEGRGKGRKLEFGQPVFGCAIYP